MPMLKRHGFTTIAMALRDDDTMITDPDLKEAEKTALFLGSEGNGLRHSTTCECDRVVRIPMLPGVDSLNVAAASAVAFWELFYRNSSISFQ